MTPFAEGVWLASDPVRIVGMRLSATMALSASATAASSPIRRWR